jgi:uncharacterized membrane protein YcaP (DUF421 family)
MSVEWGELFAFDVNPVALFVRTSLVYLVLVLGMRVITRRQLGALALPDVLLIVLIADGVQNGMSGDYSSVSGAVIVAGTLLFWNYALDALSYRVPFIRRLLQPEPLKLVQDGRMLKRNMRQELVTEDELRNNLRVHGITDLAEVETVCLEPDGELSVIKKKHGGQTEDGEQEQGRRRKQPVA